MDHVVARGQAETRHAYGRLPAVDGHPEEPCLRLAGGEFVFQYILDHRHGIVRAAVVDEDEFDVVQRLREQGTDATADVLLDIVNGDYDADCWHNVQI